MIHTNHPIIRHKAGLLHLAEELGNVSRVCKVMCSSSDPIGQLPVFNWALSV